MLNLSKKLQKEYQNRAKLNFGSLPGLKKFRFIAALLILFIFITGFSSPCNAQEKTDNLPRETQKALYEAQEALKKNAYQKAEGLLREYLEKHSDKPDSLIYYALGNALYMNGNPAKAYKAYEKGLNLDPASFSLCLNLAKTAYDLKRFAKAGNLLEKAYRLSRPQQKELLYQAGAAYYQAEENKKALKVLKQLFGNQRKIEKEWLKLYVHVCLDLRKWSEAEKILKRFLSHQPEDIHYWELLAQISLRQNRYKDAAAALEIAYKIKPPALKKWEELANIYFNMNLPLKAVRVLEKAFGSDLNAGECEKLSDAFVLAQHSDKAVQYLDKAISRQPSAERYLKKGRLYYERGRWKEAVKSFKSCVNMNPGHDIAHLLLGYCALETKDFDLAQKSFLTASKKGKYKKDALAALEILKETDK